MNVCMGVFLIVTGGSILQPTDPVEDFQRVVDGVVWSDPTETPTIRPRRKPCGNWRGWGRRGSGNCSWLWHRLCPRRCSTTPMGLSGP